MSEEKELPRGWVWTSVGEIYDIVGGGTPSTDIEEYWNGDIAWVTSADICGLKDIRPRKRITKAAIENSATNLVPEESLIVVTRVGLGKVALTKMPLCFSQDSQALIGVNSSVYPDYSLYYLAQAVQIFKYQNRGTTIAGVTKKQLSELPFALPPLAEQYRIVAAIEQQFTRLDAGVAALQRVRTKLKRYRAAVLKAAVEGKLTEAWRAEHPATEPASLLLERILKERRAKWEADLRAKGKDSAKLRYVEPAKPYVESLPELPEGWCWATVDQISQIQGGLQKQPSRTPRKNAFPYLRVANVLRGRLDLSIVEKMELFGDELHTLRLEVGDLLIVEGNGSKTEIGRSALWNGEIRDCIHQNHIIRVRLSYVIPEYIDYYWNSPEGNRRVTNVAGSTSGLYTLSVGKISRLPVPLPPLLEQEQIVAEVEQRLSIVSELEAIVEANLKRAERLRQSILREAFAGRLVPQDPTDEPASVLLERICSERDIEQKNGARVSKRTGNKRPALKVPEPVTLDVTGVEQATLW